MNFKITYNQLVNKNLYTTISRELRNIEYLTLPLLARNTRKSIKVTNFVYLEGKFKTVYNLCLDESENTRRRMTPQKNIQRCTKKPKCLNPMCANNNRQLFYGIDLEVSNFLTASGIAK